MIFALIFSNFVTGLVIKARGTWTMVFALVPLPFLLIAFKLYCRRTFDDRLQYYHKAMQTDGEAVDNEVDGKGGKKGTERLSSRFGHPALYKPLITPMVHAKAADALIGWPRTNLENSPRTARTWLRLRWWQKVNLTFHILRIARISATSLAVASTDGLRI
jgi:hypothetical protein